MIGASKPDLATYIKEKRLGNESSENVSAPQPPFNKEGAWAAVGFAVVLLVIGVPVWWHTTTVHRAPLPYASIAALAPLRRLHLVPVTIWAGDHHAGEQLATQLSLRLKTYGDIKFHVSSRTLYRDQMIALRDSKTLDTLVSNIRSGSAVLAAGTATLVLLPTDTARALIGREKLLHVTNDNLIIVSQEADVELLSSVLRVLTIGDSGSDVTPAAPSTPPRPSKPPAHKVVSEPSYSLTITLMLPQPHLTRAHWDEQAAVDAYLSPLLKQLEALHLKVKVRCQHLYMTPLSGVQPQWLSDLGHHALPHTHLPLAINAIEAKLGSFVSTDPALHFIIYVPERKQTPLHIHSPEGGPLPSNSFVVPRWGGVMIHNPPNISASDTEFVSFPLDAHAVMTTILTQLHTLLPIVHLPADKRVSAEAAPSPQLSQWQLDALARARVSQYYDTTSITLQSLCELVGEISNMVVSEEVGGWVWRGVEEWEACGEATQEGRLLEASLYCTRAHTFAHDAFFHPSMLALLYFPDNQKYAIYVPLFLPVSIPVLLSFKMLYSLLKSYIKKEKIKTP